MKHAFTLIAIVTLTPLLFACSGTKKKLGLEAGAPDEFTVVRRAPLEMPPDYYLRPPVPGAPRAQEPAPIESAKITALGSGASQNKNVPITSGEQALLRSAGADERAANIREEVAVESDNLREENRSTFDKTFGTNFNGTPELQEAIDPIEEANRLKDEEKKEKQKAAEKQPKTSVKPIE